jgi:hypothetical protein
MRRIIASTLALSLGCLTLTTSARADEPAPAKTVPNADHSPELLDVIVRIVAPSKKTGHFFFIGNEKLHAAPNTIGSGYGITASGRF